MAQKVRVACIKFAGMAVGGSELWLQKLAANLPKDTFSVDYFYCDAAPYIGSSYQHVSTNAERIAYVKNSGVRVFAFTVGTKDVRFPDHPWRQTNFWSVFHPEEYDLIQTIKAGPREYPYDRIDKPIIEIVALANSPDKSPNIAWSFHSSPWQRDVWIRKGGSAMRSSVLPAPLEVLSGEDYREELGIPPHDVVAGFHQRVDDGIFSPIPLEAFSRCQAENRHFIIKGGSRKYREQAESLGLRNMHFLPPTGDSASVSVFLNTLDFMAHGRRDGETFGAVLAEAMMHGKPILSHWSDSGWNAHVETIGPGGYVAHGIDEYAVWLERFYSDTTYRTELAAIAADFAKDRYSIARCIDEVIRVYREVLSDPSRFRRERRLSAALMHGLYGGFYFLLVTTGLFSTACVLRDYIRKKLSKK